MVDIGAFRLRGLKASDRTTEEQKAVNQAMGYKEQPKPDSEKLKFAPIDSTPTYQDTQVENRNIAMKKAMTKLAPVYKHMDDLYTEGMAEFGEKFGYNRSSVSSNASEYLDKVASEVSSYYKKYKGTDKLPATDLTPEKIKSLAMTYAAKEKAFGKDAAAYYLDNEFKNIVGKNQSWFEQAWNGFSHLVPSIEGGAVELVGNIWGTINPIVSLIDSDLGLPKNENLGWWHNYLNNIIDNPVTRAGRDIERAGASYAVQGLLHAIDNDMETATERIESMKNSATKYNPEGIGSDAIVLTEDQEKSVLNSATPWEAMQSSGFTTLSMVTGAGLAGGAGKLFGWLGKGANYLHKTGKVLKTAESLEKALINIKKAQNVTNLWVVPGLTGGVEGMQEGLNTKIQVEQDKIRDLDDFYKDKIEKEVAAIAEVESKKPQTMTEVRDSDGNKRMVKSGGKSYAQIYKEVFDKYRDEYLAAREQIEFAASEAGVHNFWANSLINGALNMTLKAGLQSDRVQETMRNSKLLGWSYKKPKFTLNADGTVKPKFTKLGAIKQYLKEPVGEAMEEGAQSLSNDAFAGAASNNVDEFIRRKFDGDGNVQVGEMFGSDFSAGLMSFYHSFTDPNTIKSSVLGAVGSVMGSASLPHRGYKKDENGNIVKGGYWGRQLKNDGTQETKFEAAARMMPWRSGLVNSYFDRRREKQEATKTAEYLNEWLQDPQHRAKWDGLVGTASWMNAMHNAAESNDQFNYRNSQMGKAINDAITLSQLKGTDLYETIMTDLQRSSEMDVNSQEGQSIIEQMRNSGNEDFQNKTDEEVIEKIKSNANKMLGIMSEVEKNGDYFDRLLGRVDENTKQSLIFGKMMEKNFKERKEALEEEIDRVKGKIQTSRGASQAGLTEELKSLIIKHGSLKQAMKAEDSLLSKKENAIKRKEELETIGKDKLSDKQHEELEAKTNEIETLSKQLEEFNGLYEKDAKGKVSEERRSDLNNLVLNEQEVMDLDPITRSMMFVQEAAKYYNATHQNRQKIDALSLELDEIQQKIDVLEEQKKNWIDNNGRVKKGHNKQVQRNDKAIEKLEKKKYSKERELNIEKGEIADTKEIYSEEQQAVMDNLVEQAQAMDEDFVDKVVDMGRLERGIKNYHQQLQSILLDPKAFSQYVDRAKFHTAQDLLRRRAERVSRIDDYKEFSRELDKLMAGASPIDVMTITQTMQEANRKMKEEAVEQKESEQIDRIVNEEDNNQPVEDSSQADNTIVVGENTESPKEELVTNWDKYKENQKQQEVLWNQISKNAHLTDNDISLLGNAMQYLSQEGINVTDRESAVEALLEADEKGNIGGKFRQWVEEKNASLSEEQRAFMPQFTSIGQVVNDYVELLNGAEMDRIDKSNNNPVIVAPTVTAEHVEDSPLAPTESIINKEEPSQQSDAQAKNEKPEKKSGFNLDYSSPDGGQFVDSEGTVATGASIVAGRERERKQAEENTPKTPLEESFSKVTTPEIAKSVGIIDNLLESMQFTEDGKNVVVTDEEKQLARQSLEDIAVNNEESLDTKDDLVTAIRAKAQELQDIQSKVENEKDKRYGHAAEVLKSLARRIQNTTSKNRTYKPRSSPAMPMAGIISTANIAYIQSKNKEAWAVRFTDNHAIDEWNREHTIAKDTPVYFITDSEWTAAVTSEMNNSKDSRDYNRAYDMPVVAAVEVESPKNPDTTTAIQIGEKWYQPIGIMPGVKSTTANGAARTAAIRSRASQEQGVHLITENGMPNGTPLVTHVAGKNYIDAHHPDDKQVPRENTADSNHDLIGSIINTLPIDVVQRLQGLTKEELLKDPEYQEAREKFLNRVSWGSGYENESLNNQAVYTPDDLKHNEGKTSDTSAQPMILFRRDMDKTTARTSDKTLSDVLMSGNLDDVVNFNSRTQRLFNEVIRPLFKYLAPVDKQNDRSAKLVIDANPEALKAEADRLTKLLNGYTGEKGTEHIKGFSNFIHVSKNKGWSIQVIANADDQITDKSNPKSVYQVYLVNADASIPERHLSTIEVGQNIDNTENAKRLLDNYLYACINGELKGIARWQIPSSDINNLNNRDKDRSFYARRNIGAIVDDGILELGGSSLVYDTDRLKLYAPITNEGKPAFSIPKTANAGNAQQSGIINITPQGQGAIITHSGSQVDPDTGAMLDDNKPKNGPKAPSKPSTPVETEAHRKARELTETIIADSKEFVLSSDESHYYIENKETGQRTKYLRVTTVIGADETANQWIPKAVDLASRLGIENLDKDINKAINLLQNKFFVPTKEVEKIVESIADKHGIDITQVRKTLAEMRTEHKKNGYGAWKIPSSALGNTADTIVRDFFAGKLKDSYPNISKEVLSRFVDQLSYFKQDIGKNITLVSEGIMAHGHITITDSNGQAHQANVAGTLDLFGYDNDGNFYIFDMKTKHAATQSKLNAEKPKWSRQVSMYADLLEQTYGIKVNHSNLRIIPINVGYDAPRGNEKGMSSMGPVYSVTDEGQLQMERRNGKENFVQNDIRKFTMMANTLDTLIQPGYTPFNIRWDNLSSEDQALANALSEEVPSTNDTPATPEEAHIEKPDTKKIIGDTGLGGKASSVDSTIVTPMNAGSLHSNGMDGELLGSWSTLDADIKQFLSDTEGIDNEEDYNVIMEDSATKKAIENNIRCPKGI